MRDLMKAGSPQRLRLAAATMGWQRQRTFPGPNGHPAVAYVRAADGLSYLIEDPEQRPTPTAERLRALAIARFTGVCPACGERVLSGQEEFDAAWELFGTGRVQAAAAGMAVAGVAINSDVIAFALLHAADCPARPALLAADTTAASN